MFSTLLVAGCQAVAPLSGKNDPKDQWWSLDFMAPSYMSGLVEHSSVVDLQGKTFERPGGGAIGTGSPGDATEVAKGWNKIGGNEASDWSRSARANFHTLAIRCGTKDLSSLG